MHFALTEEQNLIRDMVREFAEKEVGPSAGIRDEEEHFDRDLMFGRLAELGLTGIIFPEQYGGGGTDYLSYAIAVEELSRVCASTGVTLSAHISLGSIPVFLFGTEEQKQRFLKPMAQEKLSAFGLTEPSAGSDAGGFKGDRRSRRRRLGRPAAPRSSSPARRRGRHLCRFRPDRQGCRETPWNQRLYCRKRHAQASFGKKEKSAKPSNT